MIEKFLSKFAVAKVGDTIAKVMDGADKLFTSKGERLQLQNELTEAMNKALESERNHNVEVIKAEFANMANARAREIAVVTDEHTPSIVKIITPVLSIIIVCATLGIWAVILFRHYEPKTSESMIIGALTSICSQVISYYFGSSTGSQAKQKQLDKIQNKI